MYVYRGIRIFTNCEENRHWILRVKISTESPQAWQKFGIHGNTYIIIYISNCPWDILSLGTRFFSRGTPTIRSVNDRQYWLSHKILWLATHLGAFQSTILQHAIKLCDYRYYLAMLGGKIDDLPGRECDGYTPATYRNSYV